MSFSKVTDNGIMECFQSNNFMNLFKTVPVYLMAICLFFKLMRFEYNSIKPIEKLLRRHF